MPLATIALNAKDLNLEIFPSLTGCGAPVGFYIECTERDNASVSISYPTKGGYIPTY